jgi:hypothetical protein
MIKLAALVAVVAGGTLAAHGGIARALSAESCEFPHDVQVLQFDRSRYPNIYQHYLDAIAKGWPKIMIIERTGADSRRDRLLAHIPPRVGQDRDEWPAAVLREGWLGDMEYVPSSENRSQGGALGAQLRGLCDGVRVRYEWTP